MPRVHATRLGRVALSHAIVEVQRIKAITLKLDGVLVGEMDARLPKFQMWQQLVVWHRCIRLVEPNGTVMAGRRRVSKRTLAQHVRLNF
jgi:hypothetical protein